MISPKRSRSGRRLTHRLVSRQRTTRTVFTYYRDERAASSTRDGPLAAHSIRVWARKKAFLDNTVPLRRLDERTTSPYVSSHSHNESGCVRVQVLAGWVPAGIRHTCPMLMPGAYARSPRQPGRVTRAAWGIIVGTVSWHIVGPTGGAHDTAPGVSEGAVVRLLAASVPGGAVSEPASPVTGVFLISQPFAFGVPTAGAERARGGGPTGLPSPRERRPADLAGFG